MTYSLPIFIIDDINQEFDSLLNVYQDHVRFYDNRKLRNDELVLANIITKYLLINDMIGVEGANTLQAKIITAAQNDISMMDGKVQNVANLQSTNASEEDVQLAINEFLSAVETLGTTSREYINDELVAVKAQYPTFADIYLFGIFENTLRALPAGSSTLSAYVGNGAFGRYSDEAQSQWVFNEQYKYMQVVNALTSQCFI
ncbi:MAG: hypothetical protein HAW67_07250 [Endozoicomonadaceae bacterium]|nr:hypothetical protein [Endozoicomonadaceae bacterium]